MMNLQYRDIALLTTELPDLKHYPELKDHQLNGVQRWGTTVGYNKLHIVSPRPPHQLRDRSRARGAVALFVSVLFLFYKRCYSENTQYGL